jgi:hypothetical protein
MSHGRTQIRNALVTALTGLTTTGARVFAHRIHPVTDAELPCLMISTDAEQVVYASLKSPRHQVRELTASVRILARATSNLTTTLDTSCTEIEAAILANLSLGGVCRDIRIDRTDITLDDGAERPTGMATLTLIIEWATREGVPETPLGA